MTKKLAALVSLGLLLVGSSAEAGIISYTSQPTWAMAAGPLTGTETFDGFGADAQFRTTTVAANNMSIAGVTGLNGTVTNKIDVSPFEFSAFYLINGTPYLLGDLQNSQTITITFTNAVSAWGADFRGVANAGRPTRIDVYSLANVLIGSVAMTSDSTNSELQFYGFTTTGGDVAGSIRILNPSSANDVFSLDNVGFVSTTAIPEPATLVVFGGLALAGAVGYRRRKGTASA